VARSIPPGNLPPARPQGAPRPSSPEPADLGAYLRTAWLGRASAYHQRIGSTQDEARRLALAGAPHGFMVWAAEQTAGRGRLERRWYAPRASGLWFSVIVRPGRAAPALAALPLAVGAAVAGALDQFAPGVVRLKWPNDVLFEGRKLAGILVEGHTAEGVMDHAVVGVGINLRPPPGGFTAEISDRAAALSEATAGALLETAVLAGVLGRLEAAYDELLADGPGLARSRWLALADTIGREVVARAGGVDIRGTAVDLDEAGNLVVAADGELRVVAYGEVEHLR
jgi:BirA family biotin operon repressor/biotin-[acetyl-CoA-carboxylase] ligase